MATDGVAAGYHRIDHTADVGLRLIARSPEGLFVVAAEGLNDLWAVPPEGTAAGGREETLEVRGGDTESLLVAWLNELIFQATVNGRVAAAVADPALEPERFSARVRWRPISWDTCRDGVEIKAATYHAMQIVQTPEGAATDVIFDV